ncbi:MAG: hypothetical protein KF756_07665 [Acidobacteria bacterium]|nr:hypothetical protein [Acidobacteriota bacterium]
MGADSTYLFYGVRYQVTGDDEIAQLENGTHPLVKAANKGRLQTVFGNFSLDGDELYILYVGREIAVLGYEGVAEIELSDTEFMKIQLETRRKLSAAGFSLVPALFAQFEPDV